MYAVIFVTKSGNLIHISAHEVGQTKVDKLFGWSEESAKFFVETYNKNKKDFVYKSLNYKATYMTYEQFKLENKNETPFFKVIHSDGNNGFSIKQICDMGLNAQ